MKKTASTISLCKDSFLSDLNQFCVSGKIWIAFSGGMDSCILLHLFYSNKNKINQDIEVLYVNHGLQKEAGDWGIFCGKQCKQYGLAFTQLQINNDCPTGESIEAWAREKRYFLIEEKMNRNDVLFTAHHLDDQVETFFLQALRGSGPRGLASMPAAKKYRNVFHVRPLLNYSRDELKLYAENHNLVWQDDKSNLDVRYDRNYFRHKIMPVIEERWPSYRDTISRLIKHQSESKALLDEVGHDDLKFVQHKSTMNIDVEKLKELSVERQKNLIFIWIKELGLKSPGSANMQQIISDVIHSAIDKAPCVSWKNVEIRRYKDLLYASIMMAEHDAHVEYVWKPKDVLSILGETIIAESTSGRGLLSKSKTKGADFIVRYRQGGEKIYLKHLSHSKTVKQLFQESSILPWLRDRIPLVYINGELASIPGFCTAENFAADVGEPSWDIRWSGYEKIMPPS